MRFTKIRYSNEKVEVGWETANGQDKEEHTLKSSDAPRQEFLDALEALKPDLLSVLELPKGYAGELEVTTITIDEDRHGRFGVVVSGKKKVTAGTVSLSTPRLQEPAEESEGGAKILTDEQLERIRALERAAAQYANGSREQRDLFEGEEEEEEEELEEAA